MEPPFETLNRTALPAQLDSCQQSDSGCVRFSCLLIKLLRFIRRLLMRFKVAFVDSLAAVGSRRAADPLKRLSHDMRRLHFAVHLTDAAPPPLPRWGRRLGVEGPS